MIRTQVYLPDDLYKDLKLLAANSKKNFSELIREGVSLLLKKQKVNKTKNKKNWENFIGAYKGNVKTNAVKMIDDYYKEFGE